MSDDLMQLVSGLKEQVEKLVLEVKTDPRMSRIASLHQALNTLEESCDLPKTSLVDLFDLEKAETIRPDEFYGLEPLEAAKLFLRKRGQAATFSEIIDGILAGGGATGSEEELRVSLGRSTTQVVKMPGDRYGLLEFYPHVRRERGRKKKSVEQAVEESIDSVAAGKSPADALDEAVGKPE